MTNLGKCHGRVELFILHPVSQPEIVSLLLILEADEGNKEAGVEEMGVSDQGDEVEKIGQPDNINNVEHIDNGIMLSMLSMLKR